MKPTNWPQAPETNATDHPRKQAESVEYQRACDDCWRVVEESGGLQTWVEGAPDSDGLHVVEFPALSFGAVSWTVGQVMATCPHGFRWRSRDIKRHMRISE